MAGNGRTARTTTPDGHKLPSGPSLTPEQMADWMLRTYGDMMAGRVAHQNAKDQTEAGHVNGSTYWAAVSDALTARREAARGGRNG